MLIVVLTLGDSWREKPVVAGATSGGGDAATAPLPLLHALMVMFENSVDGPVLRSSSDCRSQVDVLRSS